MRIHMRAHPPGVQDLVRDDELHPRVAAPNRFSVEIGVPAQDPRPFAVEIRPAKLENVRAVGVTQSDVSNWTLDVSRNTEVVGAPGTGILVKINRSPESQAGVCHGLHLEGDVNVLMEFWVATAAVGDSHFGKTRERHALGIGRARNRHEVP